MTEEQEDKILSGLFRQKLENTEVIPSPSVSRVLLRRLGRREFLRFNPGRFNIWYAGGIIAAGAALAIILTSGNDNHDKKALPVDRVSDQVVITDSPGAAKTSSEDQNPDIDIQSNAIRSTSVLNRSSGASGINESGVDLRKQRHSIPALTDVAGTLHKNGLFKEAAPDKSKLRGVRQIADLIQASAAEGCCPLKVLFGSSARANDSCRWTFGDGGYSNDKNPEWIFDVEGDYKVTLQIFDSEGMQSVSSSVIIVYPRPEARFEIVADNNITSEDEISFINFSTDAVKFRWHFGDGNTSELFQPRHSYTNSGNYDISLVATSGNGCSDTLIVSNAVTGSGNFINFPNAFIPNPDGPSNGNYSPTSDEEAHIFHPVYSGVSDYQLRIFSKLSVLIFESNDINIGWDGYYNGRLCEQGVYIWKISGTFLNGEQFSKMGDLTLLRN